MLPPLNLSSKQINQSSPTNSFQTGCFLPSDQPESLTSCSSPFPDTCCFCILKVEVNWFSMWCCMWVKYNKLTWQNHQVSLIQQNLAWAPVLNIEQVKLEGVVDFCYNVNYFSVDPLSLFCLKSRKSHLWSVYRQPCSGLKQGLGVSFNSKIPLTNLSLHSNGHSEILSQFLSLSVW